MQLPKFRPGTLVSQVYPSPNEILDSATEYELYAKEAHDCNEEELAQFFEELAQLFHTHAEELAMVASTNSVKSLIINRWQTLKELVEF